jgi:hypothetical protein
MTRKRLPDRRPTETVALEHSGTRFMVTIGFYPDGRPGERIAGRECRGSSAHLAGARTRSAVRREALRRSPASKGEVT